MTHRLGAGLAVLSLCALTGCSGSAEPAPASPTTAAPTEEIVDEPTPSVVPTPKAAGCDDPAGDATGVVDLRTVRVAADAKNGVTVTYAWDGETPSMGRALWVTTASSGKGGDVLRWEYRWSNGNSETAVVEVAQDQERLVRGTGTVEDGTLTVTFPAAVTNGLDEGWVYTATVNVEGDDSDSCEAG